MRPARLERTSSRRECERDDVTSEPDLDDAAVSALLETRIDLPPSDDPLIGIRNGVIAGLVLWTAIALIFVLIA